MKREFLQNFKVGDQPLPKEVIDSILNEHSRSIGTLKAEKENLETQLQAANLGFNIPEVKPPQIPMLAKGAVLPANKPILAMVGDQKHGTNVETPPETIQEAVALVMEDMAASNIAGIEAVVAVLREILGAELCI